MDNSWFKKAAQKQCVKHGNGPDKCLGPCDNTNDVSEFLFTSTKPASVTIVKFEETDGHLKLKVNKEEAELLKLEGSNEGRNGPVSIDVYV
ncbi:hypothetical protein RJ639_046879 [Escallonia herrerae]|uniref:Uncharacterized protein n=1 Tax=Escallonia herrerae TaxID=1293975 RepID=A0AA88W832_9ASTE|nr:hypothetical protein RJ639_046879 [Escallonia herrerae]